MHESNPAPAKTANSRAFLDDQDAAKANSAWASGSVSTWLCGHREQQDLAQAPSASSMIALMVRAHLPHWALQPRHP
jgi:hypothetical protein